MITYINPNIGEPDPESLILEFKRGYDKLWLDFGCNDDGRWDVYVAVSCGWQDDEYPGSIIKVNTTWYIQADDFPKLWKEKLAGGWDQKERER